ncbi:Outer membrane protein beta-barrel domain-containing protein [Dyadobacter koreensis]|uniref:Outer membrane protein beta-barrel domain-containing protein n=2 Tax=Dyadobacter koreensis TaxID=408657 RepID=A0A1H7A8Z4_9BACT|nr:Outer membrane protein beta-barrel domain-containing protein [Dyadobacter koreensis]
MTRNRYPMKHTLTCLILFIYSIIFVGSVKSQTLSGKRYMPPLGVLSLTGGVGVAYYMGDLRTGRINKHLGLGPSVSIGALYRLTEHFSARGELRFYQVSADQKYTPNYQQNLSFKTFNPDLNVGIQADLFAYNRHAKFNPYLLGGVGVTYMTPKTEFDGNWISLAPLQTEGVKYNRLPLVFMLGAGFSTQIAERWSLGMELVNNFVNSDYLDDVSTVYPDYSTLPNDLARQLSDRSSEIGAIPQQPGWHRGRPARKDMYLFLQVRVNYLIGTRKEAHERRNVRCPRF